MQARSSSRTDTNPNTQWIHHPGFRVCYIFLLFAAWLTVRLFDTDHGICLSIVLQAHAIFTFVAIHWIKGAPQQGAGQWNDRVENLTFWEQIDEGYYGTPTRRFLSIVPIVLFFTTLVFTGENMTLLIMNFLATCLLIIPKLEALFGVRIFGVNSE